MKIVKINDNLKINIEQIYSLERTDNHKKINKWKESYNYYIDLYAKNPITLPITDNKVFTPTYDKENDPEDLKLYAEALNNHIIEIIGAPPEDVENFIILLITGLKINISKSIYEVINNYLELYVIKEDENKKGTIPV